MGKRLPELKVTFHNVEPTEEQAIELMRVLDKVYFDIFDKVWEEMQAKKKVENK